MDMNQSSFHDIIIHAAQFPSRKLHRSWGSNMNLDQVLLYRMNSSSRLGLSRRRHRGQLAYSHLRCSNNQLGVRSRKRARARCRHSHESPQATGAVKVTHVDPLIEVCYSHCLEARLQVCCRAAPKVWRTTLPHSNDRPRCNVGVMSQPLGRSFGAQTKI
jgi:hypothetical protein